jgi:Protein of unknown function (DUF3592)
MADRPLAAAIAGVILVAIGLAMAAGLLQVNRAEQREFEGWEHVDGTVVELLKRRTAEGEVVAPLIAFTTGGGERISFTPGGRPPHYYVTDTVPVIYPLSHPQDARIDPRARRWTRNTLAGGAALILVCLGGYVAWYASRWDRMAPPQT